MAKLFSLIALFAFLFINGVQAQTVWNGPTFIFYKPNYADPSLPKYQDRITPTTWITRGYQEGIYNIFSEQSYSRTSPQNTEWATGTLENYASLTYQPWVEWARNKPPYTMIGVQAVLHLIAEDIYIGITFLTWNGGGRIGRSTGGGFSYKRTTNDPPSSLETFFRDADGDGYGNYYDSRKAATQPEGYVKDYTDCNDSRADINPGAEEICDGLDDNCDGFGDEEISTTVSHFTLVNADTNEDIRELKEGDVIDLSTLATTKLNIRANTSPAKVNSVLFELQGPKVRQHTENLVPYALFADDTKGNYYGSSLPLGDYTLTATPVCNQAWENITSTIHFKVFNSAAPVVTGLTLVNADTDKEVKELKDGDVLDLSTLLGAKLNIRANVRPSRVGSMVFQLKGPQRRQWTENGPPYALFGDIGGDYFGASLPAGDYTLTATPYSATMGKGDEGNPLTIRFLVLNSAAVSGFTLVNAQTGEDIRELKQGGVINLATLPSQQLNIRANTTPGVVGGVVFDLSGAETRQHTENLLPYAMFGDDTKGNYLAWTPAVGSYALSATPYSSSWGKGLAGTPLSIHFSVINQTNGSGCPSLSFNPAVGYPRSDEDYPRFLATGDFNGDGKTDLAFAYEYRSEMGVLLSNGDGSFAKVINYKTGFITGITTGDFNADGKVDLAITLPISKTIGVLLGKGNGSFAPAVSYPSGGDLPGLLTAGDINQDGKPDLAVALTSSGKIGVLLGKGDGSFTTVVTYPAGSGYISSIVKGDFNQDGKLDLAVAHHGSGKIAVLLAKDDGSFASAVSYPSGGDAPGSLTVGDFNQDGRMDLAVADYSINTIGILLNKGGGSFAPVVTYSINSLNSSQAIAAGDFNGDGNVDLAVTSYGGDVFLGKGDGSFVLITAYQIGEPPTAIATGDFNGDGNLDLAGASPYGNYAISVYLNSCERLVSPTVSKTEKNLLPAIAEKKPIILNATPSPFTSQTTIRFSIEKNEYATLGVYNLNGAEVKRLYKGHMEAGREYRATMESKGLPAGIYILRLASEKQIATHKVVLLR
jgi:hypothetical protein